jgi:hypothetical protein
MFVIIIFLTQFVSVYLSCNTTTCTTCNTDTINCDVCKPTGTVPYNSGGIMICYLCITLNCNACSADNVCTTCAGTYKLNNNLINNVCYNCPDSQCTFCSADNVCTTCAGTYKLNNNLINNVCYNCPISQCTFCSANDTCHTCNVGYTLDNNLCIPCGLARCTACTSCYSSGTYCSGCLPLGKLYLYQHQCYSTCPVGTYF